MNHLNTHSKHRMMVARQVLRLVLLLLALQILTSSSLADQLPIKTYTTADGLPSDDVRLVRLDSRGFLWMAAGDGISRFDGYSFRNYTTDDGLADRRVNDFLETKSGVYWLATDAGLCRFNPMGVSKSAPSNATAVQHGEGRLTIEPMFAVYNPTNKPLVFNVLLEDETGTIWCGTNEGLYRLEVSREGSAKFHFVELSEQSGTPLRNVTAILRDRHGVLWCGVDESLARILPDGRVEHYSQKQGVSPVFIISLFEDREGDIWGGTRIGESGELLEVSVSPDSSRRVIVRTYGAKDGFEAGWFKSLMQTRDGKLWAATITGLYFISPSNDGTAPRFHLYNAGNGLCPQLSDVTEDNDGNLWLASMCGTQKVVRNGFTGYGLADGLGALQVNAIFENHERALFVVSKDHNERIINKFDGTRFQSVQLNVPSEYPGWGWGQTIVEDHLGEWWITHCYLYRFPKVDRIEEFARLHPQFMRTMGNDSKHTEVFRIYEDSRGDIWMAMTGIHFSLLRWERKTRLIHDHTAEAGVPPRTDFTAFCEDGDGNLWIGTSEGGGLLRYRNSRFRRFTTEDGVPPGWIMSLYLDQKGRLWIASNLGGLNRIDDLTADALHVTRYTTADGLSSNNIRAITEDKWGRIYVGTGHGVDRLDEGSGSVKQFTVAYGLPKGTIEYAHRDAQGALWFGSLFGLSRFIPERQESLKLPSVYLTGLRIEGVARAVSEVGSTDLPMLYLAPSQTQVSVDYVGLGTSLGEELRYQYRLEGTDDDWSAPTIERTINFASLAPGAYHFRVRAVDADGRMSSSPATFAFKIAAPVWRRWWFICLAGLILAGVGFAFYRYRVARIFELVNMRTRIATDLHDDIGANLTKISILSEVAKQKFGKGEVDSENSLTSIARISRESVASMGDIVWAISPRRDSLLDLVRHMREHAEEVFALGDVNLSFEAPGIEQNMRLGIDLRRDVFLIFKEAINNAARHGMCRRVKILFRAERLGLLLVVADDGVGFTISEEDRGEGLVSMRRRAQVMGGTLQIESGNGRGTTIRLQLPIPRRQRY